MRVNPKQNKSTTCFEHHITEEGRVKRRLHRKPCFVCWSGSDWPPTSLITCITVPLGSLFLMNTRMTTLLRGCAVTFLKIEKFYLFFCLCFVFCVCVCMNRDGLSDSCLAVLFRSAKYGFSFDGYIQSRVLEDHLTGKLTLWGKNRPSGNRFSSV